MPKRPCPFAESFSSQYKIHISPKELNDHGVFGNMYRQEIYDKTKSLLFNGTKAIMGRLWKVDGEEKICSGRDSEEANVSSINHNLLKGQTVIGFDGKLKRTDTTPGGAVASVCCSVCKRSSACIKMCSQCERPTCPSCTHQCANCSSPCCTFCITTDYSDRYEKACCSSCATW